MTPHLYLHVCRRSVGACCIVATPGLVGYDPRPTLLGHILPGVEDSPAYLSMLFAINAETDVNFVGRRGRPCLNLLDVFRKDLKIRNIVNTLRSLSDFENLRVIALDRVLWKSYENK